MRSRILHLADLHLGDTHDYAGESAPRRRAEADGVLRRIVDQVLSPESPVGGVVIAGDLFESHDPAPDLVESCLAELARLSAAGIRLLTVPGNHDEYSYPSCVYRRTASRWPDLLVTNPAPEKVGRWNLAGHEVDLYAMAFVAGRSRPPFDRFAVSADGAKRIAVLHGSLDVDWADRSLPLRSSELAGLGLDYVALGHIHRPMEKRLGSGWICYPGRIEGGGFDDPGGADLVEIDLAASELSPLHRPFASRRIAQDSWNLSGIDTAAGLDSRLESLAGAEDIVRLELTGFPGFDLDLDALRRLWSERFYHLELVAGAETAPASLAALAEERTIRGAFAALAARRLAAAATEEDRRVFSAAVRHALAAFASGGTEARK